MRYPLKVTVNILSQKQSGKEITTASTSTPVGSSEGTPVSKLVCTLVGTPVGTAVGQPVETTVNIPGSTAVGIPNDTPVSKLVGTPVAINEEKEYLQKQRTTYPFDRESNDEDYYSELDVDDTELFTVERRKNKDEIELQIREIDSLQNSEVEGDTIIVENFTEFLRNKRNKDIKEGGYSQKTEPTTINGYASVVQNDILKAFHKLVSPFDARWLIDCKSPKHCTFDGEE